jgi:hypothetical protein
MAVNEEAITGDLRRPTGEVNLNSAAEKALRSVAAFWFVTALIGQWMFVYYILAFYGGSAVQGNLEAWNKVFPRGYIAGQTVGNLAVAMHLFLAVVIHIGGPLQLVPQIRARFPDFHRWTGRIYIPTAVFISIVGLHMVWFRGAVGDFGQHIAISLNAVLIILCAVMTLRYALRYDIPTHRRWALRLFIVASGVWFFRVGLMFWIIINQGPAGFDPETFTGPFLSFWAFAQYLLPLTILELYLCARDNGSEPTRIAMAVGLFILTIAMAVGIIAAMIGMWLPRL